MITITINSDFRKFKKDDIIKLNVESHKILFLVGTNGSGKSTICRGIRGFKDSLQKINKESYDGMESFTTTTNALDFSANCNIEGLDDYNEIFCLDRIADDPLAFDNCATAVSLIMGGGMLMQHKSGGEKSALMLGKFISQVKKVHKDGNKALFVLDEADDGFGIMVQQNYVSTIYNIIKNKCNINDFSVIIVTHNPLTIISKRNKGMDVGVYDLNDRKEYMSPNEWFYDKTELKIL